MVCEISCSANGNTSQLHEFGGAGMRTKPRESVETTFVVVRAAILGVFAAAFAALPLLPARANAAAPAVTAQWTMLGADASQFWWAIDISTLKRQGEYVSVAVQSWKRTSADGKTSYDSVQHWLVDCSSPRIELQSHDDYDASGKLIASVSLGKNPEVMNAPPGSTGKSLQQYVCAATAPVGEFELGENPDQGALLGLLVPGAISDWEVGPTSAGTHIWISRKFVVELDDNRVYFYVKVKLDQPQTVGDQAGVSSFYGLAEADCGTLEAALTAWNSFGADGKLLQTRVLANETLHLKPSPAGGVEAQEVTFACSAAAANSTVDKTAGTPDNSNASGTAWMGPRGYLITAAHVVEGAESASLFRDGRAVGTAEVVASDPVNDVAVLRPKLTIALPGYLPMAVAAPRLGEHVFTLGYPSPDTMGLTIKLTSGEVSSLAGADAVSGRLDDLRLMQVSIPTQPGNSGGPVLDDTGRVVGIIASRLQMISSKEIAQNVSYALKISYARALIDGLPPFGPLPRSADDRPGHVIDAAGQAVFLVVVNRKAGAR